MEPVGKFASDPFKYPIMSINQVCSTKYGTALDRWQYGTALDRWERLQPQSGIGLIPEKGLAAVQYFVEPLSSDIYMVPIR
jgi:hypothetical protein